MSGGAQAAKWDRHESPANQSRREAYRDIHERSVSGHPRIAWPHRSRPNRRAEPGSEQNRDSRESRSSESGQSRIPGSTIRVQTGRPNRDSHRLPDSDLESIRRRKVVQAHMRNRDSHESRANQDSHAFAPVGTVAVSGQSGAGIGTAHRTGTAANRQGRTWTDTNRQDAWLGRLGNPSRKPRRTRTDAHSHRYTHKYGLSATRHSPQSWTKS